MSPVSLLAIQSKQSLAYSTQSRERPGFVYMERSGFSGLVALCFIGLLIIADGQSSNKLFISGLGCNNYTTPTQTKLIPKIRSWKFIFLQHVIQGIQTHMAPSLYANLVLFLLAFSLTDCILDRSFYEALQIPVSATQEDIREAFRKLSKKYHPDRNPESRQKFQQINVAYQTLYDPGKKYLYDRVGKQKMNDPNLYHQMNVDAMKGPQLKIKVFLQLKDFYLGKELDVMVEKQISCPHCHGTGAQNPYDIVTCRECGGQGKIQRRVDLGGGYYNLFTQTCPRCQGKGKVIGRKCHICKSQKIIPGIEEFALKIKPGQPSNSELRYTNMGDERMIGAPSDIVFELVEIQDKTFQRNNQNLHANLYISLEEAILGFRKVIKHLDGHEVVIERDEITQPGYVEIIEGEGMPVLGSDVKGKLYVTFKVNIPNFTEEELNELEDFFSRKSKK